MSVVILFNHEGNVYGAAQSLIDAALGATTPEPAAVPEGWDGQWLAEDGLLVRLAAGRRGLNLLYNGWGPDLLDLAADGSLASPAVTVRREGERLRMVRKGDNTVQMLSPLPAVDAADAGEIAGRYTSDELGAGLEIDARDGGAYMRFTGLLGTGRPERMAPAGKDVWLVATRRSMDAPAPGDWTAVIRRDANGKVAGLTLGCWLARGVDYARAG